MFYSESNSGVPAEQPVLTLGNNDVEAPQNLLVPVKEDNYNNLIISTLGDIKTTYYCNLLRCPFSKDAPNNFGATAGLSNGCIGLKYIDQYHNLNWYVAQENVSTQVTSVFGSYTNRRFNKHKMLKKTHGYIAACGHYSVSPSINDNNYINLIVPDILFLDYNHIKVLHGNGDEIKIVDEDTKKESEEFAPLLNIFSESEIQIVQTIVDDQIKSDEEKEKKKVKIFGSTFPKPQIQSDNIVLDQILAKQGINSFCDEYPQYKYPDGLKKNEIMWDTKLNKPVTPREELINRGYDKCIVIRAMSNPRKFPSEPNMVANNGVVDYTYFDIIGLTLLKSECKIAMDNNHYQVFEPNLFDTVFNASEEVRKYYFNYLHQFVIDWWNIYSLSTALIILMVFLFGIYLTLFLTFGAIIYHKFVHNALKRYAQYRTAMGVVNATTRFMLVGTAVITLCIIFIKWWYQRENHSLDDEEETETTQLLPIPKVDTSKVEQKREIEITRNNKFIGTNTASGRNMVWLYYVMCNNGNKIYFVKRTESYEVRFHAFNYVKSLPDHPDENELDTIINYIKQNYSYSSPERPVRDHSVQNIVDILQLGMTMFGVGAAASWIMK